LHSIPGKQFIQQGGCFFLHGHLLLHFMVEHLQHRVSFVAEDPFGATTESCDAEIAG
jgi:hypothetical protein